MIDQDHVILFINGLNNCYVAVRNQILLTDPPPSMSRAYSLVLQIKQQNEAYQAIELNAFNLDHKGSNQAKKPFDKRRAQTKKRNIVSEYCKKKDHGRDTCFNLHGVPDWFKELPNKKPILTTNATGNDNPKEGKKHHLGEMDLKAFIKEEMKKLSSS